MATKKNIDSLKKELAEYNSQLAATNIPQSDTNKKKPKGRGDRPANHVVEQRQFLIDGFVLRGWKLSKIRLNLENMREQQKKTPELVPYDLDFDNRTLERYVRNANKDLAEILLPKKRFLVNRRLQRLDDLYDKAIKENDIKAAIMADDRIAEMFGLKDIS